MDMILVGIVLACLTVILLGIFILALFAWWIRRHRKHSIGCWVSLAFGVVMWSALIVVTGIWWWVL